MNRKLNHQQAFSKWLEERKGTIESVSRERLAQRATEDLGFEVAVSTIVAMAKAADITLARQGGGGGVAGFSKVELIDMRDRIEALERFANAMANALQLDAETWIAPADRKPAADDEAG